MDSETHLQSPAAQRDPDRARRFQEVVDPHLNTLYRTARRFARNRGDAEDLVQETLFKAWRSFDTFRPGTNPRAWLSRILRNAHYDGYRGQRRMAEVAEGVHVEDVEDMYLYTRVQNAEEFRQAGDPAAAFFSALTSDQVEAALRALRPQYREVFVLADLEGFSYREISEIVGIPEGTVMSRLSRARHQLQKALWEYCLSTGQCRAPAPSSPPTPPSADCRAACRQIYAHLGNALDAAAVAAIDQHLQRCRPCCDRFEFQRRLTATIRDVRGTPELPDRLQAQLRTIVARF